VPSHNYPKCFICP